MGILDYSDPLAEDCNIRIALKGKGQVVSKGSGELGSSSTLTFVKKLGCEKIKSLILLVATKYSLQMKYEK